MSLEEISKVDEVICPCDKQEEIIASEIGESLKCPKCNAHLKQRAYLPFLEYLMENGYVQNLDFFDLDQAFIDEVKEPKRWYVDINQSVLV